MSRTGDYVMWLQENYPESMGECGFPHAAEYLEYRERNDAAIRAIIAEQEKEKVDEL